MVLRTCEAEINGKIQNKFCLCVIGLCSLGFIQICFPPAAEKLNISEHRCVSFVRQCWSTHNKETFPFFKNQFPVWWKSILAFWCFVFLQTIGWKLYGPRGGRGDLIFLDMSKCVRGWKETEAPHNLITSSQGRAADTGSHCATATKLEYWEDGVLKWTLGPSLLVGAQEMLRIIEHSHF